MNKITLKSTTSGYLHCGSQQTLGYVN